MISQTTLAILIHLGVIGSPVTTPPEKYNAAVNEIIASGDLVFNEKSQMWELPPDYLSALKDEGVVVESLLATGDVLCIGG